MTSAIHILNGSFLTPDDLSIILRTMKSVFRLPVLTENFPLDIGRAYDSSRAQYNSTVLLAQILSDGKPRDTKRLALVDVDLFIPVLTFVFGEAQFGGQAGIVSTHRLQNQFYGLPRNDALLLERLEKEIIHELGHTFGLYHCRKFDCVMRSSTYAEEIDLKQAEPCSACTSIIEQAVHSAHNA